MLVWVLNQLLKELATDFFVGERGGGQQSKFAVGDVLNIPCSVGGVLDEPFTQPYRPASLHRLEPCPSYVARRRAGMATPLSWLS